MDKKFLSILLTLTLLVSAYVEAFAAAIDTKKPYDGDYLLAVNTSIDGDSIEYTGDLTTKSPKGKNKIHSPKANRASEVIATKIKNGKEIHQIDARNKLPKMKHSSQKSTKRGSIMQNDGLLTKSFVVANYVDMCYESKSFTLKYQGENCNIWLENDGPLNLTAEQIDALGAEYDNKIYSKMTTNYGSVYDIDGDGKTAIILYDIQDGFDIDTNPYYISGFFDSIDFSDNNNMDLLHIDTFPSMGLSDSDIDITNQKSVIVHELQHLINYSHSFANNLAEMPLWLNEGLSLSAQHMIYEPLTQLVEFYNTSSSIANGYSLFYWDDYGDVIANYALSYLFVQYLRAQTKSFPTGGTLIYKSIIESSNRTSTVVKDVMNKFYPRLSMDDILINFKIATFANEPKGQYGFMSESEFSDIKAPLYDQDNSIALRGGGSIIKEINGAFKPSEYGDNIKFVGIKLTPKPNPDHKDHKHNKHKKHKKH